MRMLNPRDFPLRLKMKTIFGPKKKKNPDYIIADGIKEII